MLPVSDTLKRIQKDRIAATLPREDLAQAQTPQGFHFDKILQAHRAARDTSFTDDASIAEGATFETVLDELRHKMALHYLDGKKVSVNEIAYLVGFSEAAAFSRAFKRWTGTSPRKRV